MGAISGVASAISSIYAGKTAAIGYKMQAAARRAQASQAVSMAKMNNLKLQQQYNDAQASQIVMGAAQGRSGATLANIARVDKSNLEWDKEYMRLSGEYQSVGILADAMGYDVSAGMAKTSGLQKGLLQLASTAQDYSKIGSRDNRKVT